MIWIERDVRFGLDSGISDSDTTLRQVNDASVFHRAKDRLRIGRTETSRLHVDVFSCCFIPRRRLPAMRNCRSTSILDSDFHYRGHYSHPTHLAVPYCGEVYLTPTTLRPRPRPRPTIPILWSCIVHQPHIIQHAYVTRLNRSVCLRHGRPQLHSPSPGVHNFSTSHQAHYQSRKIWSHS